MRRMVAFFGLTLGCDVVGAGVWGAVGVDGMINVLPINYTASRLLDPSLRSRWQRAWVVDTVVRQSGGRGGGGFAANFCCCAILKFTTIFFWLSTCASAHTVNNLNAFAGRTRREQRQSTTEDSPGCTLYTVWGSTSPLPPSSCCAATG